MLEAVKTRWKTFAFLISLAALVAAFFHRVVFDGQVFFFRDFELFFYPKRFLAASAVRDLQIPFWENLSSCGVPVLGAYQSAVFYPLAAIYYLAPMPSSLMLFVVAHFLVTGAGAFYMLRTWGVRRVGACAGALLWTFAPAFVSVVDAVSFMTALAWLPWCLAFARKISLGGGFRAFAGLAVTFAMALLAGAPEPVIFIAAAVAIVVLVSLLRSVSKNGRAAAAGRAALVAVAVIVAVLLAGVELAPFSSHLRLSERAAEQPVDIAAKWSMSPGDVALWALPRFRLYPERGGVYWPLQRWLKSSYLGAAAALLAAWTLLAVRRRRNVPFAVIAGVFVVLAFGAWSPVWRFAYHHVPGFSLVRYPVKFFLPVAFAASTLAAFAIDDLAVVWKRRPRRVALLIAALALLGALSILGALALDVWPDYIRRHILPPNVAFSGAQTAVQAAQQYDATRWTLARSGIVLLAAAAAVMLLKLVRGRKRLLIATVALGVVAVADVFIYGGHLNPTTGPGVYTEPPVHLAAVDTGPGAPRCFMTHNMNGLLSNIRLASFGGVEGLTTYLVAVKGGRFADPDNVFGWAGRAVGRTFTGIDDLDAYLSGDDTLIAQMAENELYKESFWINSNLLFGVPVANKGEVMRTSQSARLWDALWVMRPDAEPLMERLYAVSAVVDWAGRGPEFTITRLPNPVPRALLVRNIVASAGDESALNLVTANDFDPRKSVVLLAADAAEAQNELGPPLAVTSSAAAQLVATLSAGSVKWLADTGNAQTLEVDSPAPALLYVADNYYPAFEATVDGNPARIYRANYAFRAVSVPAGRHEVRFAYRPSEFYVGLAATLLGVVVLLAAGLFRRRSAPATSSARA